MQMIGKTAHFSACYECGAPHGRIFTEDGSWSADVASKKQALLSVAFLGEAGRMNRFEVLFVVAEICRSALPLCEEGDLDFVERIKRMQRCHALAQPAALDYARHGFHLADRPEDNIMLLG